MNAQLDSFWLHCDRLGYCVCLLTMKFVCGFRFIEEPTAPDDVLGHAAVRKALKPFGIGVATGEHAHNRMIFKQLLQAEAIDVCQIDSCRLAGVSEVLSVLLMAAK